MLFRVAFPILLGSATTIAVAGVQASRFDRESAHVRFARDPAANDWRWNLAPGGPPRIVEAKIYTSHGAIQYTAMADRSLPSCFPSSDEFDPRPPVELIPPRFRSNLVVSWPVGDGTDPFLQAGHNADVANQAYRSVLISGWPAHALWCQPVYRNAGTTYVQPAMEGGVLLSAAANRPLRALRGRSIIIPLRPLWQGFALNTALFACAWALLLFAPRQARRWLRLRKGLCPHCAYDLRATPPHSPCPECGHITKP